MIDRAFQFMVFTQLNIVQLVERILRPKFKFVGSSLTELSKDIEFLSSLLFGLF